MNYLRGEIYIADLNPVIGSEQSGIRPVIILQKNKISQFSNTVIIIPLTTNLNRATLPSCVLIQNENNGLLENSVALCHQIKAIDKRRIINKIGNISVSKLFEIETTILFTLGFEY